MPKPELSVAIPKRLNQDLLEFLIRKDTQEDLLFGLWNPSYGKNRFSALVDEIIYPETGDRQIHGNASFNPQYFDRACALALERECGIAFLHSHPFPGWQGMSRDDIQAEQRMASPVNALTDLPLVGMTTGADGTWSARMWDMHQGRKYSSRWCHSVRVSGSSLLVSFNDALLPKPKYRKLFKRTVTVWGEQNHTNLARLNIGIVGLGSVGSIVSEHLARMGMTKFTLIDFDKIEPYNLDRLLGATEKDIGRLKVDIMKRQILKSKTANSVQIIAVPYSITREEGYRAALDCDILFSCVDRARPRNILNHFAYAHLIPVIDGGIEVRFNAKDEFTGVDWQLQAVGPGRPCLSCIGAYEPGDVSLEENGMLDNPSYMKGLPKNHRYKNNENVFPFSANLASLEVLQFIALATEAGGVNNFGIQRYRYLPGIMEADIERKCHKDCYFQKLIAKGDRYFFLYDAGIVSDFEKRQTA